MQPYPEPPKVFTMQQTAVAVSEAPAEISAAALLRLLSRAEASALPPSPPALVPATSLSLSPYHAELLQTIVEAVFSRTNENFYAQCKGYGPEKIFEIVVGKDDLRPLA